MEQVFADWSFEDNFHMSTNKRSIRPEDELVELLWRDGQVVLQSQARRERSVQVQTHKHEAQRKPNNSFLNNQGTVRKLNNTVLEDQQTVSWIEYPPHDVDDPFESEFSSHFFSSIDDLNCPEKPQTIEETLKHETQTMARPKFRSSVITVGPSHCESNHSTNDHQTTTLLVSMRDRSKNVEGKLDTSSGGSSGCSYGRNNKETVSGKSVAIDRKRKQVMDTDQESVSQAIGNKSSQRSGSTRRSRAAEVHNLSERRRRDRINERMKALQELIPHCSKTDKASILDEAIDYLKSLQMQLQVMWMGSGMAAAAAAAAATNPMMSSPYMNQMAMQSQMQMPQFPVMNRSNVQNHPGLVCQNPVQFQMQAQNQILSEQLARYMGGFQQMPPTANQAVQQPLDMLRFGSTTGQQSQLSAPATTDSLRMR